jgi:predicted outer membrane repeat protein
MQARPGWGERGCISMCNGKYTFKGCTFEDNTAREGAALFIGAGDVLIEDCYFGFNESDILNGSTGGAIYTWCNGDRREYLYMNIDIRRCTFENNTAKKGGAIAIHDKVHYSSVNININIDRCVFIGNVAGENQGGAIFYNNFNDQARSLDDITISNTLFFGNQALEAGGALCVWNTQAPSGKFSELKLINNTFTWNTSGGSPTNGGAIGFMKGYEENNHLPANMIKTIYNTIIDGNRTTGGMEGTYYSDLGLYYDGDEGNDMFDIQNSYIGCSVNLLPGRNNIPTDPDINNIDYYTGLLYDGGATVGFSFPDYYGPDFHRIPLEDDAAARTFGNPEHLIGGRDLSGKPWTIAGGKCVIGACDVTSDEIDDEVTWQTGITALPSASPLRLAQYNNMLVCLTYTQEPVSMVLYNLTGSKMLEGQNYISLRGINSGIYIAKVQIGTAVYAQKVVIK